jgi:hypothetical protein
MMKSFVVFLLVVLALLAVAAFSYRAGAAKYQSQISALKGEVAITKSQADRYAGLLKTIRETASSAMATEKTQ